MSINDGLEARIWYNQFAFYKDSLAKKKVTSQESAERNSIARIIYGGSLLKKKNRSIENKDLSGDRRMKMEASFSLSLRGQYLLKAMAKEEQFQLCA